MNKRENGQLNRVEKTLDDVRETAIRTETKLDDHLKEHAKRVKYGVALIGFVGTLLAVSLKYIFNLIKRMLGL